MENEYFGFIYETTNLINGKKYIGKCEFKRINGWQNYLGSGVYIKRAIAKYGKDNFQREIILLAIDKQELEECEELIIKFSNAVESDNYYNISSNAVGGDLFSSHPEKERIRKLLCKIRSGQGNSQYGKSKSKKMILSIIKANSKPIKVDNLHYSSVSKYAKLVGLGHTTILYRLNSLSFPNYQWINREAEIQRKPLRRTRIIVDDIEYKSVYEYSKVSGCSRDSINRKLISEKYPNYKKLDEI